MLCEQMEEKYGCWRMVLLWLFSATGGASLLLPNLTLCSEPMLHGHRCMHTEMQYINMGQGLQYILPEQATSSARPSRTPAWRWWAPAAACSAWSASSSPT